MPRPVTMSALLPVDGLSIEGEPPFGGLLQLPLPRPRRVSQPGRLMGLHAEIPHAGGFHLSCCETPEERWRQVIQAIDAHCFHAGLFFFFARKTGIAGMGSKASGVAFTPSPRRGRALPLPCVG